MSAVPQYTILNAAYNSGVNILPAIITIVEVFIVDFFQKIILFKHWKYQFAKKEINIRLNIF